MSKFEFSKSFENPGKILRDDPPIPPKASRTIPQNLVKKNSFLLEKYTKNIQQIYIIVIIIAGNGARQCIIINYFSLPGSISSYIFFYPRGLLEAEGRPCMEKILVI